jgi:hypothetical protein
VTTDRLNFQLRDTAIDGRYESRIAGNEIMDRYFKRYLGLDEAAVG